MCTALPAEVGERAKDDAQGRRVVCPYGSVNEDHHYEFGAGMYAHLTEMLEKGDLKVCQITFIRSNPRTLIYFVSRTMSNS